MGDHQQRRRPLEGARDLAEAILSKEPDAMARYERAAIQTYYSLGILNSGQAVLFTIGMTL